MSLRRKKELEQGVSVAAAIAAGGGLALTSSAALWWYFTSSLKQTIQTYEQEMQAIGVAIKEHNEKHAGAIVDPTHSYHKEALSDSMSMSYAAGILQQNLMSRLKSMARMPPPALTPGKPSLEELQKKHEDEREQRRNARNAV